GDRRCAAFAAADGVEHRAHDPDRIDAAVRPERLVLGRGRGIDEDRWHLAERDRLAPLAGVEARELDRAGAIGYDRFRQELELSWRGLIAERSTGVEARLARGPISAYIGFDPSARSLHVGQLLQVFMLTHLQKAGGTPFVIVGGGTGMIGDPSGKSSERNLLD